jgi:hypothetical protein
LREGTAQSGLGDGEGLGGFSKMQLAGQLAEIDEVAEFERILVVAGHEWESGMGMQKGDDTLTANGRE